MSKFKVVSFNVNSVRKRLEHLQVLIDNHNPDIIGLQETKVQDHEFPVAEINAMGYEVEFMGQKTHYGVATLYKKEITSLRVQKGYVSDIDTDDKRLILTELKIDENKITIINGYFPQGESRDHPKKFPAKQKFYQNLNMLLDTFDMQQDHVIVLGDFNIASDDKDIGIGEQNKKRWLQTGKTSFLPEERQWWQTLIAKGLIDTYRLIKPEVADIFSWFDFRSRGFQDNPKRGLRIDTVLATEHLSKHAIDSGIDYQTRAMPTPSDHCPVWTEFELK